MTDRKEPAQGEEPTQRHVNQPDPERKLGVPPGAGRYGVRRCGNRPACGCWGRLAGLLGRWVSGSIESRPRDSDTGGPTVSWTCSGRAKGREAPGPRAVPAATHLHGVRQVELLGRPAELLPGLKLRHRGFEQRGTRPRIETRRSPATAYSAALGRRKDGGARALTPLASLGRAPVQWAGGVLSGGGASAPRGRERGGRLPQRRLQGWRGWCLCCLSKDLVPKSLGWSW